MYLAEGIVPYLDNETLRDVLHDLRSVATVGTRLAVSLRQTGSDPKRRARFETGVAVLGEPALGSITAEDAEAFFGGCRWRPVELGARDRAEAFVVAAPVFDLAEPAVPTI